MKIAAAVLAVLGSAALAACSAEAPKPAPDQAAPAAAPAPAAGAPAAAKPAYPLDTCVVSGEKLGAMGEPVVIQHEGVEVRFCCRSCVKEFNKDPQKYLALIKAAAEKK